MKGRTGRGRVREGKRSLDSEATIYMEVGNHHGYSTQNLIIKSTMI